MIKLSVRIQYGLQAVLELAFKYGGGPVQIANISAKQKIPIRYLEQLMLILKRGGIVASTRGIFGGYALAKHPADITLLEMINLLEGPIELIGKKMKKEPVLYDAFAKVQDDLKKKFAAMTLEDFVMTKRDSDRTIIYNI
ncbi:MAG: Rrf2 family transcriptional regulator [Candidatus Margulisbacteria bacterium]|nr:Rrf2 family transcriptional regulator [Candidatus Margulisiibacteriota bacterium]